MRRPVSERGSCKRAKHQARHTHAVAELSSVGPLGLGGVEANHEMNEQGTDRRANERYREDNFATAPAESRD
jgi:hypothetical protein